ncbi:aminoglycoside phosphotransferase family protein [Streptomyces solicathayae]|uniref:Aminoglycoside phosphotransferase family protein n=2 Tax=Streptomyces TaxID=1883 RepID=A0ABZ0M332_9ACTN|nr:aminoglycoside phosphotransferase family protein [Streptomyces sp. HUAS YS2]WOX25453.1 aminoglycoside phosphotransferase family protein [Streptomyces sp. HUAS YS2]
MAEHSTAVLSELSRFARAAAHPTVGRVPAPRDPCRACGNTPAAPGRTAADVLADRADGTVVRHGAAVAKAHAPGTDPAGHAARVAVAAAPALRGILLPPLPLPLPLADATVAGRPVTAWPYGAPVDPSDPDAAPWAETARLLALLHRTPPPATAAGPLPPHRGPAKAAHAVARLTAKLPHPAAAPVLRAWAGLPAWARDEAPPPRGDVLCHGDLHLGQLVRHPAPDGPWLLIDVDDLGLGEPAWDLARPAAWYAAGILPPEIWSDFLGAYRASGGPAVPADGDPWPQLDVPARALTVQTAALALVKSTEEDRPLDEVEQVMIDTCARIASVRTELDGLASS